MRQWVKLYTEAIDDRKMHLLSDSEFRLFINLVMLAGVEDKDGSLPGVDDMCFRLRMSEQDLLDGLNGLQRPGVEMVLQDDDGWALVHWAERQKKPASAQPDAIRERVRRWREKRRNVTKTCNEDVTTLPNVTEKCNALRIEKNRVDIEESREELTAPAKAAPTTSPAPKPKRALNPHYELARAIAQVCSMDLKANEGRLLREAQQLSVASPTPTAEVVRVKYGSDEDPPSWWYANDWRGKQGQRPTPATLRQTWGQWQLSTPKAGNNGRQGQGFSMGGSGKRSSLSGAELEAKRAEWERAEAELAARNQAAGRAPVPGVQGHEEPGL